MSDSVVPINIGSRRVRAALLMAASVFLMAPEVAADESVLAEGHGTVRLVHRAKLTFGTTGRIETVSVDEGDVVEQNQVLATLYDDVAVASLAEAKAAAENRTAIAVAQQELVAVQQRLQAVQRANQLHPRAFSAVRQNDLQNEMQRACEVVKQQQQDNELAKLISKRAAADLESLRIRAPFAGVIVRRSKHPGEGASPAETVLELVSDETIRVDVFVSPGTAAKLRVGAAARLSMATDGDQTSRSVDGHVGFIDVTVQPVRKVVRVWVEAKRPDWMRDGMQVDVVVHADNELPAAADSVDIPAIN